MTENERLFRAAAVMCLFAAMVWYVVDGKPLLSAIFGVLFGTALERLVMRTARRL